MAVETGNFLCESGAQITLLQAATWLFSFTVLMGSEKIKVMRSLKKNKIPKLNKCREVILFVTPTVCICVYMCHHRSPKRLLNQAVEKGKPLPSFHHSDGPGNAFIYPQIYDWESPLALIFC